MAYNYVFVNKKVFCEKKKKDFVAVIQKISIFAPLKKRVLS